ncbi:MAG: ATP synthase F1 subunit epsilon [Anaerolineae bacterium]|nr:ATP synthase F1 subunit epsilon [Anaerolineae bacterium]
MPISVEIVTQEKVIFSEPEADMVVIPGSEGEMGVLPHHAPVLTTLAYGELIVRKGRAQESFAVYGGVVDIRPDRVVVLADLAESSYDIDAAAVEAARERAAQMMEQGVAPEQNREAALALRRAELALKVQRKVQSRGSAVMRIVEDENNNE